ncbi:MAG: hypothetical protein ACRDZO_23395, partial [Egibacteraceae bacterium]
MARPQQRRRALDRQPGRYRMVITQRLDDDTTTVVLDAEGDAFVAVIGHARNGRLTGQQGHGGTPEHVHDLAHLIADTLLNPPHQPPPAKSILRTMHRST